MLKKLGAVLLLVGMVVETDGQSEHYWSELYGTRSMLLSGVVIGSVDDLGAVFYNPARILLPVNDAFLVSADVYEYDRLTIKNALGDQINLRRSNFGGTPGLVAGRIKHKLLGKHQLAYSYITRNKSDLNFFVRTERTADIDPSFPGEELFQGSIALGKKLKEEWLGATWAYPLSKRLSIGVTGFYSIRKQSSNYDLQLQELSATQDVALFKRTRRYSYHARGLLGKLGLSYEDSRLTLGFTFTTTKAHLGGKGDFLYEEFFVGVDSTGDGNEDDEFISNLQTELDARHRFPWSVGFGAGLTLGDEKKTVLHLSAEYFDDVDHYTIMESQPFIGQSTGEELQSRLTDRLVRVFNFGLGLEYIISSRFTAFGSYSSNFSPVSSRVTTFVSVEDETNASVLNVDMHNMSGGVAFKTNNIGMNLGASYAFGNWDFRRPVDFPNEDEDIILESEQNADARIEKWRFFVGVSIPFIDKIKGSVGG